MNNYVNYNMNNVTCRFASIADRNSNDNRISLNIPNTDLYINFVIYENENTVNILKNTVLKMLDISVEKLLEIALSNTYIKEQPRFLDFERIMNIVDADTIIEDEINNVIISNEKLYYGAIFILNKEIQEMLYRKLGDFYILPSSVHEVICISKNNIDKAYLLEIVRQVNNEYFMTDSDRLADDVFEIRDGKIYSVFINNIWSNSHICGGTVYENNKI